LTVLVELQQQGLRRHIGRNNVTPDKSHGVRNLGEYEGNSNIDDRIVTDLIASAHAVAEKVSGLTTIK